MFMAKRTVSPAIKDLLVFMIWDLRDQATKNILLVDKKLQNILRSFLNAAGIKQLIYP